MAHLLVVDDDPTTRTFLREVLERLLKHSVEDAGSIEAALDLTHRTRFDLIFLDRNLPDGTALEFCQTFAQVEGGAVIPKWLVSGEKPLDWDPEMWGHYGVKGFIVKPFQIDSITQIIDQCLNQPNP